MRPAFAVATDDTPIHGTGKAKVISLWAGPGAGKSTVATGLFNLMKRVGYNCELVSEVAKELTYEASFTRLSNQTLVFAKQEARWRRLIGKVDYIISDSPIPLSLIYGEKAWSEAATSMVDFLWDDYEHFAFRLFRPGDGYQMHGRSQTLEEATKLDERIFDLSISYGAGEFPVLDALSNTVEYEILDYVRVTEGEDPLSAKFARDWYLDMKPKGLPSDVVITTLINGEQLVETRDGSSRPRASRPHLKYAPGGGDDI